jgi:hypothetical protein
MKYQCVLPVLMLVNRAWKYHYRFLGAVLNAFDLSFETREVVDRVFSQKSLLCSSSEKQSNSFRRDNVDLKSFIFLKY